MKIISHAEAYSSSSRSVITNQLRWKDRRTEMRYTCRHFTSPPGSCLTQPSTIFFILICILLRVFQRPVRPFQFVEGKCLLHPPSSFLLLQTPPWWLHCCCLFSSWRSLAGPLVSSSPSKLPFLCSSLPFFQWCWRSNQPILSYLLLFPPSAIPQFCCLILL